MPDNSILDEHIVSIIQNNSIPEQSAIQKLLKERGYDVPQATLSRRLKKLKVAKVAGLYKVIDLDQLHLPTILNIQTTDTGLIVLHTGPGQASSLAYFLDKKYVHCTQKKERTSNIVATVAGDDIVLLIIRRPQDLCTALRALYEDFPYLIKVATKNSKA